MVGIDGDVWIGEEYLKSQTALPCIVERDGERPRRREALAFKLPINTVEKRIDMRFAVSQTMQTLALAREGSLSDLFFNLVHRCDPQQCLPHRFRLICLGFEELTTCVTPTLSVRDTDLLCVAVIGSVTIRQQHRVGSMRDA
jgi:hypothetical protein